MDGGAGVMDVTKGDGRLGAIHGAAAGDVARFIGTYSSMLGDMIMTSDGESLTGLYFADQAHLPKCLCLPSCDCFDAEQASAGQSTLRRSVTAGQSTLRQPVTARQDDALPGDTAAVHVFDLARKWLDEYFLGRAPHFTPPIELQNLMGATPFRQLVWSILLAIPYGQTASYGEVAAVAAKRLGRVRMSSQAVGQAVGHNPISIIIPCHRVVGTNGTLTGYAAGLERKKWLLEMKRRAFNHNFPIDTPTHRE